MRRARRPDWSTTGTEPDPRATLANERTYLAWLRTGLATIAAATALVHFVGGPQAWAEVVVGALLGALGVVITATAYSRWAETEQRMRRKEPLTFSPLMRVLPVTLSIIGVLAVVLAVLDR
ncbi:MAG: DUF202 domain-containing protein [bacterium]